MKQQKKLPTPPAPPAAPEPVQRPLSRLERMAATKAKASLLTQEIVSSIMRDQMDWFQVEAKAKEIMEGLPIEEQTWVLETVDASIGRLLSALPRVPSMFSYSGVLNG